ncbi:F-box protein at1g70590 [Phtheirospermum japonicum]|uniref:F-box protein at1g70590 n=1 Tax=Phtheirospermum japonicum TaxID=374723 RepID=A0A830CHQ0_9LAMI|nr:F-box protein at1g70590 [Phtheirospermum japonicum]
MLPNLKMASLVCRAWRDALKPLREAMVFLKWGKRFKHGRGGVKANPSKALDFFLKVAACGPTLAMVDPGLIYWEMGKKEEGIVWYRKAAELIDPAGQCNLAITYLQGSVVPNSCRRGICACNVKYVSVLLNG